MGRRTPPPPPFQAPRVKQRQEIQHLRFDSILALLDFPDLALDSIFGRSILNRNGVELLGILSMENGDAMLLQEGYQDSCILESRKEDSCIFFSGIFLKILQIKERDCVSRCFLPVNSIMSFYLALETGKFWFQPRSLIERYQVMKQLKLQRN